MISHDVGSAAAHIANPCGHTICGECGFDWISRNVCHPVLAPLQFRFKPRRTETGPNVRNLPHEAHSRCTSDPQYRDGQHDSEARRRARCERLRRLAAHRGEAQRMGATPRVRARSSVGVGELTALFPAGNGSKTSRGGPRSRVNRCRPALLYVHQCLSHRRWWISWNILMHWMAITRIAETKRATMSTKSSRLMYYTSGRWEMSCRTIEQSASWLVPHIIFARNPTKC